MGKFFQSFKNFISKGNVIDMAIGVIIGASFNKIISSLVNDIIMPILTFLFGAKSLADLSIPLKYEIVSDPTTGEKIRKVTLSWNYGNFIQTIIDFLLVALCLFIVLRIILKSQELLKKGGEELKINFLQKNKKVQKDQGKKDIVLIDKKEKQLEDKIKQNDFQNDSIEKLLKEILVTLKQNNKKTE